MSKTTAKRGGRKYREGDSFFSTRNLGRGRVLMNAIYYGRKRENNKAKNKQGLIGSVAEDDDGDGGAPAPRPTRIDRVALETHLEASSSIPKHSSRDCGLGGHGSTAAVPANPGLEAGARAAGGGCFTLVTGFGH